MIVRITGILESVSGVSAVVALSDSVAREVLVPAYLGERLRDQTGERVTFHTMESLESRDQGATFIPRLIGFASPEERRFFDLLNTVKGIGTRKALRIMAEPPAAVASMIEARDAKGLVELPEVGKRLAETIIAELAGKAAEFTLGDISDRRVSSAPRQPAFPDHAEEAILALVALGESRNDAERRVSIAMNGAGGASTESLLAAALGANR